MYANDFDVFRTTLQTCGEVFGKPVTDKLISSYWDALKDLHIAAFERAASSHMRYGKFFPKPAELRPKTEKAPEPQDEKAINESERASVKTWEAMRNEHPAKFWRMFAKAYIGRLHFRFAEGSPEFVSSVERCLSRCNTELIRLGEVGISETEIDTGMAYHNPTGTVSKRVSAEIADEWVF